MLAEHRAKPTQWLDKLLALFRVAHITQSERDHLFPVSILWQER
jgi:hypothetical protein